MQKLKGYLTIKEFAQMVGFTDEGIRKSLRAKRKRIKKFVMIGFMYLIHESEVRRFKRMRDSTR